jgi:uncharacterized protein YndB with AHSA1/START domain
MTLAAQPVGERTARYTRFFATPRARVWEAMTEPALIRRWLWARDRPLVVCEQDFRVGGTMRRVWEAPDGGTIGVTGRYTRIEPPAVLVHTQLFDEDWTGGETIVTLRLHETGARTRMEMEVSYPSAAARDSALDTAVTDGMEEAYARLDPIVTAAA